MRLAIVVATHIERRTFDLVFTDTGLRVPEVQCLSDMVSSDSGIWNAPSVQKPSDEAQAGALPKDGRQLVAATEEAYGRPVIIGFLQPLAGMMAFNQDDRQVHRHSSGAYSTIAPDGSIEFWHPSGTYARIGKDAHESLTSISANKNWKEVTDAAAPTITLSMPGKSKDDPANFSLVISPDGTVTLGTQKSLTVSAKTGITMTTPQAFNITAQGGLNITANVAIKGNVNQTDGGITSTGDVVGAGVSLDHHVHEDDDGGPGVTGPPAG